MSTENSAVGRLNGLTLKCLLLALVAFPAVGWADFPLLDNNNQNNTTRYMAMGDSLTAGYKALPATNGFVYLLYQEGAFDNVNNTLLDNIGVVGATSQDVLAHELPLATGPALFRPNRITLTVGGNDLLTLLGPTPPTPQQVGAVLGTFASNLGGILGGLCTGLPAGARIYVGNLYTIPDIPGADDVVPLFNEVLAQVVGGLKQTACADNVLAVADLYSAFQGRHGLLLIERHGAAVDEVHPTNAGYRVIANTFEAAISASQ
jgi:lysophospholipase L1-like esterase